MSKSLKERNTDLKDKKFAIVGVWQLTNKPTTVKETFFVGHAIVTKQPIAERCHFGCHLETNQYYWDFISQGRA